MTKRQAVRTVIVTSENKPSDEELQEARDVISQAITDGYVLVNGKKLIDFLKASMSKEMAETVYNELTD